MVTFFVFLSHVIGISMQNVAINNINDAVYQPHDFVPQFCVLDRVLPVQSGSLGHDRVLVCFPPPQVLLHELHLPQELQ